MIFWMIRVSGRFYMNIGNTENDRNKMSIIARLIKNENFIDIVMDGIVKIRDSQVYASTSDALIEGSIMTYEFVDNPEFGTAEGGGIEWSLPFKNKGDATIWYNIEGNGR